MQAIDHNRNHSSQLHIWRVQKFNCLSGSFYLHSAYFSKFHHPHSLKKYRLSSGSLEINKVQHFKFFKHHADVSRFVKAFKSLFYKLYILLKVLLASSKTPYNWNLQF